MKILFTGGGSGGHFYPIIAVASEINELAKENRLLKPELYYMSTDPYNESLLYENNITFLGTTSGKIRGSLSFQNIILNIIDAFKIALGAFGAIFTVYNIFPDVVFGKGGYASFPALFAARILGIPVVIHDSDTIPGKVNIWAGKFAQRIALSYPDAAQYFPKGKTAYTGNPIRKEIIDPLTEGAHEYLRLDPKVKTILVVGGSSGAQRINAVLMDALPDLIKRYQIVHQTGKNNFAIVQETSKVVLTGSEHAERYKPYAYLDVLTTRMSSGVADLIISRAGSAIFEIADWAKPSIIIPIPEPTSHDQRTNAYAYARSGSCEVIEEKNLTPHVLVSEIDRILTNDAVRQKMIESAKAFARRDSAKLIAEEILVIALSHEK